MDKQQAMSRITHLEEEIVSHKAHIATLKNELAAACRRPMSDDGFSDHGQFIAGVVTSFICLLFLSLNIEKQTTPLESTGRYFTDSKVRIQEITAQ